MELKNKPLYALRDLASRLGVKAPTACTKTELIAKIEKQKTDIEEHKVKPLLFARGRPRLSNRYIEIKEDEDGKITFYESETAMPQERKYYDVQPVIEVLQATYPPAIEDEETRQKLQKAKEILDLLSLAITKVLER